MFAVSEEIKKINGKVIETFEREAADGNAVLRVEAGTNGYKGGGRVRGSRTYVCLDCICGDFHFRPVTDEAGEMVGIQIACCGDDGLKALMKALAFATQALDDQRCEVDD